MEDFWNRVRREIDNYLANRATTRTGLVSSYNPADHTAKVMFQPDNTLSGDIPVGSIAIGNGFGAHFAPNIGDQVSVHFLEGDHDSGIIGPRLFSTGDNPLPVPAGEWWLMQSPTSGLKFTAGDLIQIIGASLNAVLSSEATIMAPAVMVISNEVSLGATGGMPVARVGDMVNLSTGLIESGSAKVTSA